MVDVANTYEYTNCQKSLQLLLLLQDAALQTDAIRLKYLCLQKSPNSEKVIVSQIQMFV